MAKWAYVENNRIQQLGDILPSNWRNISGLNLAEGNLEFLSTVGWYPVVNEDPVYAPSQYQIVDHSYEFLGDRVKETAVVVAVTAPPPQSIAELKARFMTQLRAQRDQRLYESDWTQLADIQSRFSPEQQQAWAVYRQSLRDLPQQYADNSIVDFFAVTWPTKP